MSSITDKIALEIFVWRMESRSQILRPKWQFCLPYEMVYLSSFCCIFRLSNTLSKTHTHVLFDKAPNVSPSLWWVQRTIWLQLKQDIIYRRKGYLLRCLLRGVPGKVLGNNCGLFDKFHTVYQVHFHWSFRANTHYVWVGRVGCIITLAIPNEFKIEIWLGDGMELLGNKTWIGKLKEFHRLTNIINISALL